MGGPQQLAVGMATRFIGPPPSVESLREHVRERLPDLPSLTHHLTPGARTPRREPVPDVDLARHVHDVPVTTRGTWQENIREVLNRPLPGAEHPRWDLSLVHGYAGSGAASPEYTLVFRIHHAMQDGFGHVYVGQILFSPVREPETRPSAPLPEARDRVSPSGLGGIARDVARSFRGPASWPLMHRPPTGRLHAAFGSVESNRLLGLSRRFGTGVGEIFLAALAGAMRDLGLSEGETPAPLAVSWPLTIRRSAERGEMGNFLTTVRVELPCDEPDPLTRLGRITSRLTPAGTDGRIRTTRALTRLAPAAVAAWAMLRVADARVAPITATYVPLALRRLSLPGAEAAGFAGLGCPVSRQLLHLTLVKHRSACELTVVHDEALPRGADIPRLWRASLEELEAHA